MANNLAIAHKPRDAPYLSQWSEGLMFCCCSFFLIWPPPIWRRPSVLHRVLLESIP